MSATAVTVVSLSGEQYDAIQGLKDKDVDVTGGVSVIQTEGPSKTYVKANATSEYYALTKAGDLKGPLTSEPSLLA